MTIRKTARSKRQVVSAQSPSKSIPK